MRFSFFLPALSLLAASCSMQPTPASLSGSWTQPVPGQPGNVQGMRLLPDGRVINSIPFLAENMMPCVFVVVLRVTASITAWSTAHQNCTIFGFA